MPDSKDSSFDLVITNANGLFSTLQADGSYAHRRELTEIGIYKGQITAIGSQLATRAEEVFDAKGLTVLPGVIDSQVHFREPGMTHKEDLESGTRSALLGGVTSVFEMPNTKPMTTDRARLHEKFQLAKGRAWSNYAFFAGATPHNAESLKDLEMEPGCVGVKIFMGSSFGDLLVEEDAHLLKVLRHGRRRVAIHCEDEKRLRERRHIAEESGDVRQHPVWRDEESALRATQRIVRLARQAGRPIHTLHITTADETAFLASAQDVATVEVTPNHLCLSAPECYETLGTRAQMNPPVRGKHHQEALWKGIENHVVRVIGSDHAPHTLEEKSRPYPDSPSGMPGVQTLLPLMLNHVHAGRLSLERLVELVCLEPARIYGANTKGRIAIGADADFTLVDLEKSMVIEKDWLASKVGWSPYEGWRVTGWPVAAIVGGQIAMREGELIGTAKGTPIRFQL